MLLALACSLTTSCMDSDWDTPELTADQAGVGNPSIQETNVTTIAELKNQYKTIIETDYRDGTAYAQITDDVQIKAVVTGNDISGNIYNEVVVDDGTGAIIIAVSEGGLFGNLPVGAEVLIDLKGLYIGGYGMQAELGTPYTNSSKQTYVSRMSRVLWNQHFKLTGEKKTVEPIEFNSSWKASTNGLTYGGKLVTLKNVSFLGVNGKTTYATPTAGAGSKSLSFKEYRSSSVILYTSNFADFASTPVPTGKVNVTGIMKRYNSQWEIIIRTLDDVEEIK